MAKANKEVLDWQWITQELNKMHLLGFAQQCVEFCRIWFEVDIPIEREKIDQDFYLYATKCIFENSVFGFQNEANTDVKINQIAKSAALSETTLKHTVIQKTAQNIFSIYRSMCVAEHYAFLRGRPYLLPIAWIYRLWRGITFRKMRDVTMNMVSDVKISVAQADNIQVRSNYLKQWKV